MSRRRGVDAADGADVDHRRHGAAERHEGAEIAEAADPHAQELAVASSASAASTILSRASSSLMWASLRVASPFHRPADAARGPQHQDDLRIDRAAQPVAAADVAGDQPQLGLGNLQRVAGDVVAEQPRPLEAAMQRVAAGAGVVLAGHAARLDRVGGDAVDDEPLLDDVRGAGEGRIDRGLVAGLIEIGLVVRAVVVELRRTRLERVARRHHRGPRRIVDRDALGRVARELERVGNHHRHRIADVQHAIDRDRRPLRQVHRARRRAACRAPSTAASRGRRPRSPRRSAPRARRASAAPRRASMPRMSAWACGERTIAA